MNWPIVLQFSLIIVTVVGIAVSVNLIFKTANAEREWRTAAQKMSDDQMRLLLDIMEEKTMMTGVPLGPTYLANALAEALQLLQKDREMSEQSVRQIVSALRQPSETGRRLYADKLAQEAVKARAGSGKDKRPLVGA